MAKPKTQPKPAPQAIRTRAKSRAKLISMRPETAAVLAAIGGNQSRFVENCLWRSAEFRRVARRLGYTRKPRQYNTFEGCSWAPNGD